MEKQFSVALFEYEILRALSQSWNIFKVFWVTRFFYKQNFYKQSQAEIGKNQGKAKQHPETELLLFGNYLLSTSTLSSKNNRRHSKNVQKKPARLFKRGFMINDNKNEAENEK